MGTMSSSLSALCCIAFVTRGVTVPSWHDSIYNCDTPRHMVKG